MARAANSAADVVATEQLESTTIYVFSVPHFDDINHKLIILDCIHDPMGSLSNSVTVVTGKLLASGRSWVFSEMLNTANDLSADFLLRDGLNFFDRRGLNENLIFSHAVSGP